MNCKSALHPSARVLHAFATVLLCLPACVSWSDVERPALIAPNQSEHDRGRLHVVSNLPTTSNRRLLEALAGTTSSVTLEQARAASEAEFLALTQGAVTVPTLYLSQPPWELTAVPSYGLTFLTLGIVPTVSRFHSGVTAVLSVPGRETKRLDWRVEEDLLAWILALPATPFWALWRMTSAGEVPTAWSLAVEDLPQFLGNELGNLELPER